MAGHSISTNGNGFHRICDDHSDRLARLEDDLKDLSVSTTSISVTLEHVKEGVDLLASKIDIGLEALRANTEAITNRIEKQEDALAPLQAFVSAEEKKANEKREIVKKVILAVLTATAGGVGTMLVNWFMTNAN